MCKCAKGYWVLLKKFFFSFSFLFFGGQLDGLFSFSLFKFSILRANFVEIKILSQIYSFYRVK